MNNAYEIVRLANELELIYAKIRELGGCIIVNNYGTTMELGEMRRGDALTHSATCFPKDFIVSIGDNKWGE